MPDESKLINMFVYYAIFKLWFLDHNLFFLHYGFWIGYCYVLN